MKKIVKNCIILILLCIVGVLGYLIINNLNKIEIDYYSDSYVGTINDKGILKERQTYEIVTNINRLKEILNQVDGNVDYSKFDYSFFEENNLLFIEGGIGASVEKLKVNSKEINVNIYYSSPLLSDEDEVNFKVIIIPITKKNINVNIKKELYPDIMW